MKVEVNIVKVKLEEKYKFEISSMVVGKGNQGIGAPF